MNGGDGFRQQVSDLPQMRSRSWSSLLQPATQMPADWYAFMTGPVVKAEQTLSLSIPVLSRSNVSGGAVTSVYLRLITAEGVYTRSANDYVTVRSEARRVGKEWVRTVRSRWSQDD